MARNYNKGFFRFFKWSTKTVRDHCSDDPLGKIKETGPIGKIIGKGADKIIEPSIQKASYTLTGLTYDKRHDNPCKGSATYTAWYMSFKEIGKAFIGVVLGLPALGSFIAFLNADFMTQLRMILGLVPLFFLVYIVCRIVKWLKKKLK